MLSTLFSRLKIDHLIKQIGITHRLVFFFKLAVAFVTPQPAT
ncbi:hypothetical protein PRUB_a0963 [Pseudoalteromonas rubra]|uniref:Uncharacterized protein n=1 Tax=Pseudoalteromonas rubra TaxID=43658 RepID=A0A8T0C6N8_9GAMM|nr:hypothetical protein PRUB_a0963 [Pseudoalteromonas rubra]